MSGRIYDYGVDPICDKCGSVMWTSEETNFNGAQCIKNGCNGNPIYSPFPEYNKPFEIKKDANGEYILSGVFTQFGRKKPRSRKEMEALNKKMKNDKRL